jgi:large subunit ribosomal protein L17
MRHGKKNNHLSRKKAHRVALLSNMACSLIEHKRINTTLAKAKALRVYVEPLLTKSKTDTTHSRRVVFSYLQNKDAASELFREIAPKISDRPGGYTRIIKLNNRLGDNAEMAIIELVDFNELLLADQAPAKKKTRRRGGKAKSGAKTVAETASNDVAVEDAPVEEIQDAVEVVEEVVGVNSEETTDKVENSETQDNESDDSKEEDSDNEEKDKKE